MDNATLIASLPRVAAPLYWEWKEYVTEGIKCKDSITLWCGRGNRRVIVGRADRYHSLLWSANPGPGNMFPDAPSAARALLQALGIQEAPEPRKPMHAALEEFRDAVAHERYELAEQGASSEVINAVLSLFDRMIPDALFFAPAEPEPLTEDEMAMFVRTIERHERDRIVCLKYPETAREAEAHELVLSAIRKLLALHASVHPATKESQ